MSNQKTITTPKESKNIPSNKCLELLPFHKVIAFGRDDGVISISQ